MVRRGVRRHRAIDRHGCLGMAANLCSAIYLRGGGPAVVYITVAFRAERVTRPSGARRTPATAASHCLHSPMLLRAGISILAMLCLKSGGRRVHYG
jgi:hypothetical protein